MLENSVELIKSFWNLSTLRKCRLGRCISCFLILFLWFCNSYWNVLSYIAWPCLPLFGDNLRSFLHSTIKGVFISWLLYKPIILKLYKVLYFKCALQVSYAKVLLDCVYTVLFLTYAINLMVEFVNDIQVDVTLPMLVSVGYLMYCGLQESYFIHKKHYQQYIQIRYTDYCDSRGKEIPEGAEVFYKGKGYEIVRHEKEYRLLPIGEKVIYSGLIKLEEAASDVNGHLVLRI